MHYVLVICTIEVLGSSSNGPGLHHARCCTNTEQKDFSFWFAKLARKYLGADIHLPYLSYLNERATLSARGYRRAGVSGVVDSVPSSRRLTGLFSLQGILTLKSIFPVFIPRGQIFSWYKPNFPTRLRLAVGDLASSVAVPESITPSRAQCRGGSSAAAQICIAGHVKIDCTHGGQSSCCPCNTLGWSRTRENIFTFSSVGCDSGSYGKPLPFPLHTVVTHWKKGHFSSSLPTCYLHLT